MIQMFIYMLCYYILYDTPRTNKMVRIQIDLPPSLDIALRYYMIGSGSKDKRKAIVYLLGKVLNKEWVQAKQKEYFDDLKEEIKNKE